MKERTEILVKKVGITSAVSLTIKKTSSGTGTGTSKIITNKKKNKNAQNFFRS